MCSATAQRNEPNHNYTRVIRARADRQVTPCSRGGDHEGCLAGERCGDDVPVLRAHLLRDVNLRASDVVVFECCAHLVDATCEA